MTDRVIVWAGQIPLETDVLRSNKFAMTGIAKLAAAVLGTSATVVNGLACVPTSPATLTVNVNPGEIYSLVSMDATAYSSVAADTTHQILKSGILLDAVNLSCPAPGTAGQSINYLIEAIYQETDTDLTTLPYYNASNPTSAWSGPNNSGTPQATTRKGTVALVAKAGAAATTGTQTTPTPDAGYTGLWVVTVANGQSTITAGNITQYAGAPILPSSLLASIQNGNLSYAVATGTANAHTIALTPALQTRVDGMPIRYKAPAANTGAVTLNDGLGAVQVLGGNHAALQGGEYAPNGDAFLVWNSTVSGGAYILEECTGGALQVASATQSQHAAQLAQVIIAGGQQGRLFYNSGNLAFVPFRGNKIYIPGQGVQTIPVGGIGLAPSGLTANTLYYIYITMIGGAMGFVTSTTGHVTDAATGIEVMNGDNTKLFAGMEYATGPTTFAGLCRSWFNDPGFAAITPLTANASTSSTAAVELSSTLRTPFLVFANEIPSLYSSGLVSVNSANTGVGSSLGIDGATLVDPTFNSTLTATATNYGYAISSPRAGLSEGYHYATLLGFVSGSTTGTWQGGASAGARCSVSVSIPPRK